ncbi:AraC family transcriptional regulator [Acidisphaera sp. L21]|uniref:AraC family transcriptional regulator n=1 Tax=Acidisphaera sp. L21 TaxID=1641851 RepID=UPI00131C2903|nr:AraC family transcriptional regulator [Acidisphaera sp. L21]
MQNDPFSDFLHLVSARSVISGGLVAGGSWAIAIPPPDKIKFWGVVRGSCWLSFDGVVEPTLLEEGDVFLSSIPRALVMASDLAAPRVDLSEVLRHRVGATAQHGVGDDCYVIIASVDLSADYDRLFLDAIPPSIHVRAGSRQAQTLSWLMDQLVQEREYDPPGAGIASVQLAHLMFIQILRSHFDKAEPLAAGWLRAVTDKRLAPALRLMHGDPGRSWQLEELARAAAMSRAAFASYFKIVAGIAPMAYLTEWRMRLAEQALRDNSVHIGDVGRSLGYTSESAFSNAFKRVTGKSPMHFRSTMVPRPTSAKWIERINGRSAEHVPVY